ncbi:MAG: DUF6910 family protein [Ramlibacter sp.]
MARHALQCGRRGREAQVQVAALGGEFAQRAHGDRVLHRVMVGDPVTRRSWDGRHRRSHGAWRPPFISAAPSTSSRPRPSPASGTRRPGGTSSCGRSTRRRVPGAAALVALTREAHRRARRELAAAHGARRRSCIEDRGVPAHGCLLGCRPRWRAARARDGARRPRNHRCRWLGTRWMVFTAVAEDTADAYRDGACVASMVGWLEIDWSP